MDAQATEGLLRFFRGIADPRAANARHPMSDVLSVAILAVLCGAEGWAAVEAWGCGNLPWLATFLELPHGIPSHDTFDRVFGLLNPGAFEACFNAWTRALVTNAAGLFVAVDGKTLRRSWRRAWSKTPVHLVSAFVSGNQLVLGQLATDAKSNEITAIPKLLAVLELAGATVTIDAMGCQRQIAKQILEQKGHYVLSVKDNQPALSEKVQGLMKDLILDHAKGVPGTPVGYFEQTGETNNHGRVETRRVWVSDDVRWLGKDLLDLWPGLSSVVTVERTRQDLGDPTGKVTTERHEFISSHGGTDAKFMAEAVRSHWGVENRLHWCLDVAMNEDQCRLRVNHGAENFSRLRRIALNKLKRWEIRKANGKVLKAGIRLKQQACGWSRKFLLEALLA
jgi:predicted transposase YbfD/YdcC